MNKQNKEVFLEELHDFIKDQVYTAFPLLEPVVSCDEELRCSKGSKFWQDFLKFRKSLLHVMKDNPDSQNSFLAYALLWFEKFQDRYGRLKNSKTITTYDDYRSHFGHVLAVWRTELLELIERFVPVDYRSFFDDRDGLVSVVEDPFKLLLLSVPQDSDNELDSYRRWLARRDYFLGHLGMLLNLHRSSFEFYNIAIRLDEYFGLPYGSKAFVNSEFAQEYQLPARVLRWQGQEIPVYCDWNKKNLFALMQKVLLKQYNGYDNIMSGIHDILRGRLVVLPNHLKIVCSFIEAQTNLQRVKKVVNNYSSKGWEAQSFKGMFDDNSNIKFELQVQTVEAYNKANYEAGDQNHLAYKSRQFFSLLAIVFPPSLLENLFSTDIEGFRVAFKDRTKHLLQMEIFKKHM